MSHSKEQHRRKHEARHESMQHMHSNVTGMRDGMGHDHHRMKEINRDSMMAEKDESMKGMY